MKISVTKICNLKGILFSRKIIEKYNIKDTLELIFEKVKIVIKPTISPREGWKKAFSEMAKNGDDRLLFNDIPEDEKIEKWR